MGGEKGSGKGSGKWELVVRVHAERCTGRGGSRDGGDEVRGLGSYGPTIEWFYFLWVYGVEDYFDGSVLVAVYYQFKDFQLHRPASI